MTTTHASVPTITNVGTVPRTPRKLFVNIPVGDLQASIRFFEALGFAFNTQFTDATCTCMLVGTDAYFMLLARERFAGFSAKPAGDSVAETSALFAISAESREEVDALHAKAIAAGGTPAAGSQDHGFMYMQTFHDLDGHHWELFWMDPTAVDG